MQTGARVGPYEVVAPIAAGGMGEVFRARDPRLGRDVAIKSLPELSRADPERLARFEREAQLLAALNHPNIAAIYGLEEAGGARFLILELVEGGTLTERISEGPLPIPEALTIARQIADALQAAHDKGIIHRDLKPGNIALSADGQVKVLDFGLAKALDSNSDSATAAFEGTKSGVVLGTAAYMSPEQARGRPVDKRTDIWSFGCVLYELLSARHPFPGSTISDRITAILGQDPDWTALPPATPERVRWLVRRCLEKDVRRRLHDIADARIELEEAQNDRTDFTPLPTAAPREHVVARSTERIAWIAAAAALVALGAALAFNRDGSSHRDVADSQTYTTSIVFPDGVHLSGGNPAGRFSLSPDGTRLALIAADASGRTMLWVRPFDAAILQRIGGTEGASFPFWSPDSQFVAFYAAGKLKKVQVSGGQPVTLCDATFPSTGAWNKDNVILFTPRGSSPLYRVSASGGTASPATTLDPAAGDVQHWYPFFLPDGRHFLYFVVGSRARGVTDPRGIYVRALDSDEPAQLVIQGGSNAKFANGHLVYLREGTLVARAFDAERLQVRGEPIPLVEQVQIAGASAGSTNVAGAISVSDTGVLAYQTGMTTRSQLAWFSRAGKELGRLGEQEDYAEVALSPDGARAAVSVLDATLGTRDVWIFDVSRGLRERFTFTPGDDFAPIWSRPDGDRVVYSSLRVGGLHLYQMSSRVAGSETLLYEDGLGKFASHWSHDGRFIFYVGGGGIIQRSDIWVLPLFGDRKAYPFLEKAFAESQPQISPDGQWVAFMSGESGTREVYVKPFSRDGDQWRVSVAGGGWPRWGRDQKELFYLAPDDRLMAVAVGADGTRFVSGPPKALFRIRTRTQARLDAFQYDVTPDSQRFLVNTFIEESTPIPITLVINWPGLVKK